MVEFIKQYMETHQVSNPITAMYMFIKECYNDDVEDYVINYTEGIGVVGTHFGDEGKGKIVDIEIRELKKKGKFVINIRGQGGGNAGHTVVDSLTKKEYHFHYLPSGGLVSDLVLIGGGMLIDPVKLLKEISELPEEQRVKVLVDGRATLCTLLESLMDGYYESCKEKSGAAKVGSTRTGVGPAVSYRALRCHIQFFKIKACKNAEELGNLFRKIPDIPEEVLNNIKDKYGSMEAYYEEIYNAVQKLTIVDSMPIIQATKKMGWAMVLEVSQAFGLDCIYGNEGNFVTSTHTTIAGALADAGLVPADITKCVGVCKAYASKVGGGPFVTGFTYGGHTFTEVLEKMKMNKLVCKTLSDVVPTDLDEGTIVLNEDDFRSFQIAKFIYVTNGEKGVTTERLRDLGYYDTVCVRAAIQRNGCILAVNCMDTVGFVPGGEMKICTAYRHKETGNITRFWPDMQHEYEPVYETLPTDWNIKHATSESAVPGAAWRYLAHIEYYTGGRVGYIGTGGSDTDIIVITDYGREIIDMFKKKDFSISEESE